MMVMGSLPQPTITPLIGSLTGFSFYGNGKNPEIALFP
jgi:hypothetical protein